MSDVVYLRINDYVLPVEPHKGFDVDYKDYDSIQQTEAGTSVRWIGRLNIPTITVSLDCDIEMLAKLKEFKSLPQVTVDFFDVSVADNLRTGEIMYVTNYREKMLADTESCGIWQVSFKLEDIQGV